MSDPEGFKGNCSKKKSYQKNKKMKIKVLEWSLDSQAVGVRDKMYLARTLMYFYTHGLVLEPEAGAVK